MVGFTPRKIFPGESAADLHCQGGCFGTRSGLKFFEIKKSLSSDVYLTTFLRRSACSPATLPTELFQLSSFWWRSINFRKSDFPTSSGRSTKNCLFSPKLGDNLDKREFSFSSCFKVHLIVLLDDKGRDHIQSYKFFVTKTRIWNMSNMRHFTNAHLSQSFICKIRWRWDHSSFDRGDSCHITQRLVFLT